VSREAGRVLALDPGQVRIGLAVSDALGITVNPLAALPCVGPRKDVARIVEIVREHEAVTVVVGFPLSLDGAEGPAAVQARDLAERLRARLPGVNVELWDERLTTVEAERMLIAAGVGRRKRRRVVDGVAASLILQSYLDAHAETRS